MCCGILCLIKGLTSVSTLLNGINRAGCFRLSSQINTSVDAQTRCVTHLRVGCGMFDACCCFDFKGQRNNSPKPKKCSVSTSVQLSHNGCPCYC